MHWQTSDLSPDTCEDSEVRIASAAVECRTPNWTVAAGPKTKNIWFDPDSDLKWLGNNFSIPNTDLGAHSGGTPVCVGTRGLVHSYQSLRSRQYSSSPSGNAGLAYKGTEDAKAPQAAVQCSCGRRGHPNLRYGASCWLTSYEQYERVTRSLLAVLKLFPEPLLV